MIVDLHCHTSAYSGCAVGTLQEMVCAAAARSLDALCITEHDVVYPGARARAEVDGAPMGMSLFRGIEVSCRGPGGILAHVVVLGCETVVGPCYDPSELGRLARRAGAALILAHPFRYVDGAHRITKYLPIDAVEVDSGNVDDIAAAQAVEFAEGLGLPQVAGSDAHRAASVGDCATRLERPVTTVAGLAEEVRAGRVQPVRWNNDRGEWE